MGAASDNQVNTEVTNGKAIYKELSVSTDKIYIPLFMTILCFIINTESFSL
jgi:hypothetical protein